MSRTCPMCGQWHEVAKPCDAIAQKAHLAMQFKKDSESATREENTNIAKYNNWRDGHGKSSSAT